MRQNQLKMRADLQKQIDEHAKASDAAKRGVALMGVAIQKDMRAVWRNLNWKACTCDCLVACLLLL